MIDSKNKSFKKAFASMLLIGGLTLTTTAAFADDAVEADIPEATHVIFQIGSSEMLLNDELVEMDTAAILQHGRTYLPLRALSDAIGAELEISEDLRVVTLRHGDNSVTVRTDSTVYTVNGERRIMTNAPYINRQARTMVPVRVISEGLGLEVEAEYNERGTTEKVHVFQAD